MPLLSVLPVLPVLSLLSLPLLSCNGKDKESDSPSTDSLVTDTDTGTVIDTGDPEDIPLNGLCAEPDRWGRFVVDSNVDYAYISGSVSNGVVPVNILTEVQTVGGCTIWRRENPFCDPSCESDETCDFDGTCIPYPAAQDLGSVTVSGLLQNSSMQPVPPSFSYFDTSLPNPPWAPGALITLRTGGGAFDPVTLHGVAPAALQPVSLEWVITDDQPLAVAWDAPTAAVRTEVNLRLSVDQHGITPGSISCVFPDTGSAEVPAEIVHALLSLGITGFPAGDITRRTVDHADLSGGGGGCVELMATSSHFARVSVTGYTPCNFDQECPEGQTCNEALQRCE